MRTRSLKHAGVTLVELVITIVILGIALAAIISQMVATFGRSGDPLWQVKSLQLAQAYLDEIQSKKYDHNTPVGGVPPVTSGFAPLGPDAGESRATYNDVDDYHTLTDSPPELINASMSDYAGYSVAITVAFAGADLGLNSDQAKRIELVVTPPFGAGPSQTYVTYRGNF